MSSTPTKHIDGDVAVGRHSVIGGNATVRGSANIDHDLIVKGWLDARNIKGPNKGLFLTVAKLRDAYPHPQDGWCALVGDSLPAPLYIADGGAWIATGKVGGSTTIDAQIYSEAIAELQSKAIQHDSRISACEKTMAENKSAIEALDRSIGQPFGLVPLSMEGTISPNYLPGYVDDCIDFNGFMLDSEPMTEHGQVVHTSALFFDMARKCFVWNVTVLVGSGPETTTGNIICTDNKVQINGVPQTGKIYVDVSANIPYRWSGSTLVQISGGVALGYTSRTAFPGDEGLAMQRKLNELPTGNALQFLLAAKQSNIVPSDDITNEGNGVLQLTPAARRAVFDGLWTAAGGNVPVPGLTYEVNDVELTYEEALPVLINSDIRTHNGAATLMRFMAGKNQLSPTRTLFPIRVYDATANFMLFGQSLLEVCRIEGASSQNGVAHIKSFHLMLHGCSRLREVQGILDISACPSGNQFSATPLPLLTTISLWGVSHNLILKNLPAISIESLTYLVENAANTTAISVSLHADTFARLTDELIAAATEKQITFITA